MSYTVRPISDRTPFTGKHERSQFSARWLDTRDLLLREVKALRGRDLVLELDVTEGQIRLDGQVRADARPTTPAVRVAFESKHGPLTYATDKFWHWQDNVRAIALGLESLRRVDRYGITERGEQYTGFKALPAGRAMPASHMTSLEAAQLLERVAIGCDLGPTRDQVVERIQTDKAQALKVWREARKVVHPDRRDGDQTMWDQVEQAATVLGVAS